jgi:uncharacterized protein YidB (DUF937 family)
MTMATEKIIIGIDNETIELKGADKEAFLEQREIDNVQSQLVEAEQLAKQTARANAIQKLAEIAGLTEEEINSIL